MKIDAANNRPSPQRKWAVPLAAAAGVAVMSVAAVTILGGNGEAKPVLANPAGNPTHTGKPTPAGEKKSSPKADAKKDGSGVTAGRPTQAPETTFTVTSTRTTTIDAKSVAKILSSCLGAEASRYQPVVALRAPLVAPDRDGVVLAVNAKKQYVQCVTQGDKGRSDNHPPTFINNRLWGTGKKIAYFDSIGTPVGKNKQLFEGAGHYTSDVAKVTVSFGDDPKQYPTVMAGGAFAFSAELSSTSTPDRLDPGLDAHIHAFDASGKEIYNQQKDPQFN
ncbi:hypothetical protein ACIO3O_01290 [Streptomyces sp. NPDC087440]|uniref:hypothetical protein n=1 Tax=Streptomyces sp. NPDC087440 TaxID=3365790 RepID=UPI00380DC2D5